jgi:hypothetical protein
MAEEQAGYAPGAPTGEATGAGFGEEVVAAFSDPSFNEPDGEDTDEIEDGDPAESDDADLGGTEDDARSRYIPRTRFDEVNGKLKETREQLERLTPYQGLIQSMSEELGVTPERAVELEQQIRSGQLTPQEAAAQVEQEQQAPTDFNQWVEQELGTDVYSLDAVTLRLAERQFNQERQQAEQQAQAQHQQVLGAIERDFQALAKDFPELQTPRFAKAFLNEFGEQHGIRPNAAAMRKHAEEFTADLKTLGRNQLSEQALAEARAASERPNTAGGTSPGAAEDHSWIEDTSPEGEERFSRGIRGILRNAFGTR